MTHILLDLKPSNILLDKSHTVAKVCDFGTSKLLSTDMTMTGRIGTIRFMSPEVIRNERYTQLCDVYSFGIVMWETFFEATAYTCMNNSSQSSAGSHTSSQTEEILNPWNLGLQIASGVRPGVPHDLSVYSQQEQQYLELMMKCWDHETSNRPTFCDIIDSIAQLLK
jgi:serine/threonine protein kinase